MLNLIVKEPAPGVVVYCISRVRDSKEGGGGREREVEKEWKREEIEGGREEGGRDGGRDEGRELYLLNYVTASQRCVCVDVRVLLHRAD
jgi:hypothetical protein